MYEYIDIVSISACFKNCNHTYITDVNHAKIYSMILFYFTFENQNLKLYFILLSKMIQVVCLNVNKQSKKSN